MTVKEIAFDYETYDPYLVTRGKLKARGPSCVFGRGRVICAGLHDGVSTWSLDGDGGDEVRNLLLSPGVTLIGTNILYDLIWGCTSLHVDARDVRCSVIDIAVAESLIDEYQPFSLDALARKYLHEGKGKDTLEGIALGLGLKGDFRQHLADLWDRGYAEEIRAYVRSDADQPYRIWQMQKKILAEQNLMPAMEMNMAVLKAALFMKLRGVRIDMDRWLGNCRTAQDAVDRLRADYEGKYGKVNINSPKQLAVQMDRFCVEYKYKINIKGFKKTDGTKFLNKNDLFEGDELTEQKKILRGTFGKAVRIEKGRLVMYVPKQYAERTASQLTGLGYEVSSNPSINKTLFAELGGKVPIVTDLAQYKQAKNITDKFLGPGFGRYIVAYRDGKPSPAFDDAGNLAVPDADEYRLHCTYNVVGARQTGRLSCSQANAQQIPSRTVLFEKTDHEVNLARMCRECFVSEKGHAFLKYDYCLSMDSLFLTFDGYVRGDEMMIGKHVLVNLDGKGQGYKAYVQERDMLAFELSNGVILKQIPEHRHYATDRKEAYIKLAKDFKVGDQLAFYRDFPSYDGGTIPGSDVLGTLPDATKGYVCGLYLGDGYVKAEKNSGELILHVENRNLLTEARYLFTCVPPRQRGTIFHAALRADVCRWLCEHFGRKENKTLPDWVYTASRAFRAGLIAGILDTDACIGRRRCVITMCRETLMRKLAEFLACNGIHAVWSEQYVPAQRNNYGKEHTIYNLYIRHFAHATMNRVLHAMRVRGRLLMEWSEQTTRNNLGWSFDYASLPDDMFVQRRGAEYKSLYMARYFGRGIPADTAAALGFWQKDKFPVTIRKIYPVRGEALIMECDTHSFITANMPTMNCAQENRVAAQFSPGENGKRIRAMYRENPYLDEHEYVTKVSGLAEAHGPKIGRKYAKNIRFGVSYGLGLPHMCEMYGWDAEFAQDLYDKVAAAAPWLFELMEQVQRVVLKRRYIRTLMGRRIHLRRGHDNDAYKFMNYLIQGSSSDMTKLATASIFRMMCGDHDAGLEVISLILSVHDEDNSDVSLDDIDLAVERTMRVRECMENAVDMELPVISCPEIGTSWADGVEWDPSLGDCREFVRAAYTAIKEGTFTEFRKKAKAYGDGEKDMSFSEFCEYMDSDDDEPDE